MALLMRTTDKDGKAYGGFQWPLEVGAIVTAPDWKPEAKCGNGLHGLLNGEGDATNLSSDFDAIWWIVEADNAVDLVGKHKFQSCRIVAFGKREEITPQMRRMTGGAVHSLMETGGDWSTLTGGNSSTLTGGYSSTLTGGYWSTLTGGNRSTLTGGYRSTLTGGNRSTLTGGDWSTLTGGYSSTLTGGYSSTLTGGNRSTLTGGDWSTLTGGNSSTLTGGDWSTLTGGYWSTLTGGYSSTLTGGDWSTLTGGNSSTLTGGYSSTLTGGYSSTLIFLRWNYGRRRVLTAYVGENGIEEGKPYRANDAFTGVEVAE